MIVKNMMDYTEKIKRELSDLRTIASRAMSDYETAVQELATVKAERDALKAHDAWEHEQWQKMVAHGVNLQERLQDMTARAEKAEAVERGAT